ncbi:hypothetical protein [Empedobacter falsenii]|uniref:hypothetical protein n=1 Tax=Empedobacter falsenii TaxID=343874 RepID=UPI001C8DA29F|nr:hypothetical protein [Empedobacter falsenii]MBY0066917.1 hypothetical protein [Empedobacter falsenii]
MKHFILSLSTALLLTSCASTVKTTITNQEKALTTNDKVAFLDVNHKVPENAKKIGNTKFGDSGFSTDCDFNSNLIKARQIARENGANIVKVTESKKPDLWSSCYRMKIDFYKYEGDVKSLQQYQLQIK